jgi:hypothetical protein
MAVADLVRATIAKRVIGTPLGGEPIDAEQAKPKEKMWSSCTFPDIRVSLGGTRQKVL